MTTWPRSTSSRLMPRSSRPAVSPAWPSSRILWNISTPVTVVFCAFSLMPMSSTSSPVCTLPRSIRPVTTVPRPVMENTSSTGIHQLEDLRAPLGVAVECLERGDPDHGQIVAGELINAEQFPDLQLDELEDLLVVHHVGLVERDHDVRHTDLAGQQHVLAGLRHRAIRRGEDQDRAVHLRRTGDHVLDVVRVTGAVHVGVVALLGLVLHVRDRDGDPALLLFLRVVDLVERREGINVRVLIVQHLGDRRGQRGLAVVDVPDGADVHVRLGPLELGLPHWFSLLVAIFPTMWWGQALHRCAVFLTCFLRAYSPRAFAMISLAILGGTSAYESNCMLYSARPCVRLRRSPT